MIRPAPGSIPGRCMIQQPTMLVDAPFARHTLEQTHQRRSFCPEVTPICLGEEENSVYNQRPLGFGHEIVETIAARLHVFVSTFPRHQHTDSPHCAMKHRSIDHEPFMTLIPPMLSRCLESQVHQHVCQSKAATGQLQQR